MSVLNAHCGCGLTCCYQCGCGHTYCCSECGHPDYVEPVRYPWYVWKFEGLIPKLRWLWLRWVRRYRYEVCFACGRRVADSIPTWWSAPDTLWLEVEGGPGGIRCAPCFTEDCRVLGITVSWRPVVEARQLVAEAQAASP